MSILEHKKEFFVKAAMHAKHMRLKELNRTEAELMTAESMLHEKKITMPELEFKRYDDEIKAIRKLIKEKKVKIL